MEAEEVTGEEPVVQRRRAPYHAGVTNSDRNLHIDDDARTLLTKATTKTKVSRKLPAKGQTAREPDRGG